MSSQAISQTSETNGGTTNSTTSAATTSAAASRRRNNNDNNQVQLTNPKSYEGCIPEVGAILALKHEKLDKKCQFQVFMDKIGNYVLSNLKDGGDIMVLFRKMENPVKNFETKYLPAELSEDAQKSQVKQDIYRERIKAYVTREVNMTRNIEQCFGIIWGQCSAGLHARIKGIPEYEEESINMNVLWLIKELKTATSGIDKTADSRFTLIDALVVLFKMKQGNTEANDNYLDRFKSNVSTVDLTSGLNVLCPTDIMDKVNAVPTTEEIKTERERFTAMLFLKNADEKRYGDLRHRLKESAALGRNEYPKTLATMYELMVSQCPDQPSSTSNNRNNNNRYNVLQTGYTLTQSSEQVSIDPNWILLDTCSTDSVFCESKFLSNISKCKKDDSLEIISNGGTVRYDMKATFDLLKLPVYYNKNSLANVLSFTQVASLPGVSITTDTSVERSMNVHIGNNILKFKECNQGLYYLDLENYKLNNSINDYFSSTNISLLQSVNKSKDLYTKKQVRLAELARKTQEQMGWPGTKKFKHIVQNNLISNCKFTVDDIDRSINIFGIPEPLIYGRMTAPSQHSHNEQTMNVPRELRMIHKKIKLYIDLCYINKLCYLVTISEAIIYITCNIMVNKTKKNIDKEMSKVIKMYSSRGFYISDIFGDNEFDIDDIKTSILPSKLHICASGEHVPKIERSIRTIKERTRTICHSLPYTCFPKIMSRAIVATAIQWINAFPSSGGIIGNYSPALILEGRTNPDCNRTRLTFGSYAHVYDSSSDNTQQKRSIPSIALNEANEKDSQFFMSLETGRKIHSKKWIELPIDSMVIDKVTTIATQQQQPIMPDNHPIFEWAPGLVLNTPPLDLDEHWDDVPHNENMIVDPMYQPNQDQNFISDDESSEGDDDIDEIQQANEPQLDDIHDDDVLEYNEPQMDVIQDDDTAKDLPNDDVDSVHSSQFSFNNDIAEDGSDVDSVHSSQFSFNIDNDDDLPSDTVNDGSISAVENDISDKSLYEPIDEIPTDLYSNFSTRPRRENAGAGVERLQMDFKGKEYASVQHKQFLLKRSLHVLLTQMSANEGIKRFGERAVAAMIKELKQLDHGVAEGKPVICAEDPDSLSRQEKFEALEAINLIKEKRDGRIKGRTCANGAKQRRFVKDGETFSSPTVSLESIMATLMIDAYEGRSISIVDVPGAYLHAEMPKGKRILLKMKGQFVEIMCTINPEYTKYVRYEKGVKVLYLRLLRALYGCLESALLWYELYSSTLVSMGFTLNPYDLCVANKIIEGTQCTIAFYVDDNKISHKNPEVVKKVISELETHFGKLTVESGSKFNFLGMDVNITKDRKIEISMKKQIQEAIQWYGEDITNKPSTPANKNLFSSCDDSEQLNEEKSEIFHSIVAKLLYITKRARPDIETAVAFLCTRVSKSTHADWLKLKRVLGFLKKNIDDVRIIGASSLLELYTWIDAAYGVHDSDLKGHTGGCMSFGTGTVHQRSSKQKINVKSSTEAELVGSSEYVPYNVWLKNFLESQGYVINDNVLFQDNESTIKMQTNGRRSCTGNSRHVHIRYFFVKNLIDRKQIRVVYCPTGKMLADFFTKPLQGELYRYFRNIIMGYSPITDLITEVLKIKERVEKNAKWHKYEKKLICEINEINPNSRHPSKKVSRDENTLNNNNISDVRHKDTTNSTNTYVRIPKSTVQYVEHNKDADASTNDIISKPTYASIVKKGAKINNTAHKLN